MTTLRNNLPEEIAFAKTVNSFKSKMDLYLGHLSRRLILNRNVLVY